MTETPGTNNTEPQEKPQEGTPAETPANDDGPKTLEEALAELAKARDDAKKYQGLMRSEEDKKKGLFKELEEIKKSQMTDAEKAIAEAEARGRSAAQTEFEAKEKQYKLQAAAAQAGVPEDVLGLLDPSKLFDESGAVNTELLSSLSGNKNAFQRSARELNIGGQSNTAGQLTREDLRGKSAAEITKLRNEGRLDALMKGQVS